MYNKHLQTAAKSTDIPTQESTGN